MSQVLRKEKEPFTYDDYVTWPDTERWEIIDGNAYCMCPSPKETHQRISHILSGLFFAALKGKPCRSYYAPFDVILSEKDVVKPDIFVVCDPKKITTDNIQGAPDVVIEILSFSTADKDQSVKKNLYERSGVKEYLIVDPVYRCVFYYKLGDNGKYLPYIYFSSQQELPLLSITGLILPLWEVFDVEKKSGNDQTPSPGSKQV